MSSSSGFAKQPTRSYIATSNFSGSIFTYTAAVNRPGKPLIPGFLGAIAGANGTNCPANRILRETGKKLFPGVHSGVNTYMVSVFDTVNLWNGFIDPNSPLFAVYSTDNPSFFADGVDAATGSPVDSGPPVITNGLVRAGLSVSAGTTVTAGTSISAGTSVAAGTSVTGATVVGNTSVTAGKFNTTSIATTAGGPGSFLSASAGKGLTLNSTAGVTVYTTAVNANSIVIIIVNDTVARYTSVTPASNNFTVYAQAGVFSAFSWLVIN